jgi:hypothetical protein
MLWFEVCDFSKCPVFFGDTLCACAPFMGMCVMAQAYVWLGVWLGMCKKQDSVWSSVLVQDTMGPYQHT